MMDRRQAPYSVSRLRLSNHLPGHSVWRRSGRRGALLILILALLATQGRAVSTLMSLAAEDAPSREVIEQYTLARQLKTVRMMGTLKNTDWIMDRPAFAATLARHLNPALERYHINDKGNGTYTVDDMGSLRGTLRVVARVPEKRIFFVEGEFRSLAHLLTLTGNMVFTLEYRERWDGNESYVEVEPQLFVRLNNVFAHGVLKMLGPLLNGVIDRRVAGLTDAAQIVSRRLAKNPRELYQEIRTWPDVQPTDLEEFRQAFHIARDSSREAE